MQINANSEHHTSWYQSTTFKFAIIGLLVLLLLIPLGMVKSVIREREETERQVEREMIQQWGSEQLISGPVLHIPVYTYHLIDKKNTKVKKWLHIMPNDLFVTGNVEPEIRYRGIYKQVLYNADIKLNGYFEALHKIDIQADEVDWSNAHVTIGVSDNRGVKGEFIFKLDDTLIEPESGLITSDLSSSGVSFKTPLSIAILNEKKCFEANLNISGAKSLLFNPVGKKTSVDLTSTWTNPSFFGSFLPVDRNVDENGFTAKWTITHLNRNFPQHWIGKRFHVDEHQFGVKLYDPVNHYQKSLRSAKYGILIICLTLLVFLFIELVKKKEIQIIQYMLVGLALVLFFSILTALREHLGFTWAYLVASLSIISLVTLYSYGMIKDKQQAFWIFILLSILYAFLFVLLQLNDFAFLAGNIGLLLALGAIMKASLKIKTATSSQDSIAE